MWLFLTPLVLVAGAASVSTDGIGTFWQITDIHYDANYSKFAQDQFMCHRWTSEEKSESKGEFGDYNCDSPWALVQDAIHSMKVLHPHPDFILWTGDSVPHVPDRQLDAAKVFTNIANVTRELLRVFPDSTIYPSIGNHDAWPSNQQPSHSGDYYNDILIRSGWSNLLDKDSQATFSQGGYYTTLTSSALRIVQVNSNLWYEMNHQVTPTGDPAGQLAWLQKQLHLAKEKGQKVLLMGHVPPGSLARAPDMRWFIPAYNTALLDVLQQFSHTITAAFFGHEHTDSFRVVYDKQGKAQFPMFLAPAVTPWKSSIPGIGANNPSLRLYKYNRKSGAVVDYHQYYLNLTAANLHGATVWEEEYRATDAYNIKDVSAESLHSLAQKFKSSENTLFDKYYVYNSVSYDTIYRCRNSCKLRHFCSITKIAYDEFDACMQQTMVTPRATSGEGLHVVASLMDHYFNKTNYHPHHHKHHHVPRYMFFIIGALVFLVVFLFVLVTIMCCRRRHSVTYFSQPRYMPINS